MPVKQQGLHPKGIRFSFMQQGREIARARLYIMENDLHKRPFGFIEDVFVHEEFREKGLGTTLVKKIIRAAKKAGCYKLILTSKLPEKKVQKWYRGLGFRQVAVEMRMDFH